MHGLVQGRADAAAARRRHVEPSAERRPAVARLSAGHAAADGAAFVEGFLAGSGTVLVHDAELLGVDRRVGVVARARRVRRRRAPLLRRTFGAFEPAERRQLGQLVAGQARADWSGFGSDVDRPTCRRRAWPPCG